MAGIIASFNGVEKKIVKYALLVYNAYMGIAPGGPRSGPAKYPDLSGYFVTY
jgi:hypothetical protein